jgi:hypothetical protein
MAGVSTFIGLYTDKAFTRDLLFVIVGPAAAFLMSPLTNYVYNYYRERATPLYFKNPYEVEFAVRMQINRLLEVGIRGEKFDRDLEQNETVLEAQESINRLF